MRADMKKETRGRKPKENPRILNINIRVNRQEKEEFSKACEKSGKSQADFILSLIRE
jgi:uncharacterized protein (DUF1778 family)